MPSSVTAKTRDRDGGTDADAGMSETPAVRSGWTPSGFRLLSTVLLGHCAAAYAFCAATLLQLANTAGHGSVQQVL